MDGAGTALHCVSPILIQPVSADVTIYGLTLAGTAATEDIEIWHGPATAAEQTVSVAIHPSVTEASVALESTDDTLGNNEAGVPVTMTLRFKSDTASDDDGTTADIAENFVTITLPSHYDLDTDGSDVDTDDGGVVTIGTSEITTTEALGNEVEDVATGDTIIVGTFAADTLVTVTITGLMNPASSSELLGGFKQGIVPAATADDPMYHQTETVYITKSGEWAVTEVALTSLTAEQATEMSFALDLIEGVEGIVVPLGPGFTVGGGAMLTATQDAVEETASYSDGAFTIEINEFDIGEPVIVTITGLTNPDTAGAATVTVTQDGFASAEGSVIIETTDYDATDATEPGSNQSLRVRGRVVYASSDNITVNLEKFTVPGSIDVDNVSLNVNGMDADPSDVETNGTKVTLVAPFETSGTTPVKLYAGSSDLTTITFRRSAGIILPILHGDYDIKVSTSETPEQTDPETDVGGDGVKNMVAVERQVKVSPTSGTRGTEITITGKGFADCSATLRIDNSVRTGSLDVVDGAFTYTVLTDVLNSSGNKVFDMGADNITVPDSRGQTASAAVHTVKASFSISPEEISPGEKVVITLKDAPDVKPTTIRFAGDNASQVSGDDIGNADDTLGTTWDVTGPDVDTNGD